MPPVNFRVTAGVEESLRSDFYFTRISLISMRQRKFWRSVNRFRLGPWANARKDVNALDKEYDIFLAFFKALRIGYEGPRSITTGRPLRAGGVVIPGYEPCRYVILCDLPVVGGVG